MPALPRRLHAVLGALTGMAVLGTVHAHGGGLDRHGCHNDRTNGGDHCHRAAAPPPAPVPSPAPRPAARPAHAAPPSRAHPVFRNCGEARAAGAAPVHRGDPGYGPHLDRDDDGVGCEPPRGR
ncbi:excalibur calcium-binding domain-containing protein [Luteimonas sp. BLCC-B24]|uniref:excalibur calcium-binding domain-containing protein n=1 Tax=Luteimonas sp. BLCC-B24 TaxID=3025317 RepID=UPI0031F2F0C9